MSKKIIIVGSGLSGLSLAYFLRNQNISVQIIEANDRLGGRIFTKESHNTKVELGATWLWDYNVGLKTLCSELNINLFEQQMDGYALFEAMNSVGPQKFELPKNQEVSYRIEGGSSAIIKKLAAHISSDNIHLKERGTKITEVNNTIKVTTNLSEYIADFVVTTIPPKLLVNSVDFNPNLPEKVFTIANNTHTWMKDAIKFAVVYKKPFWKESKLSGVCFSHVGPFTELYDHSDKHENYFSLMGFMNSNLYQLTKEQRESLIIKQLVKFFGKHANNFQSYEEKVWKQESLTCFNNQFNENPHQNNGHPVYQKSFFNGKLFLGGTETCENFPGYMEGCVLRSIEISKKLKELV